MRLSIPTLTNSPHPIPPVHKTSVQAFSQIICYYFPSSKSKIVKKEVVIIVCYAPNNITNIPFITAKCYFLARVCRQCTTPV